MIVEKDLKQTTSYSRGMELLVTTVQELSLVRSLEATMLIVRRVARQLTGADGATFVLRDGDKCFYADEDAISPLWKGHRFPMETCISGWAMLNRRPAVIEDIYADDRIPIEAYRPTFVKSLVMVPIRTLEPVGAIGNYWATRHEPTSEEVSLLQALADITAVTLENVNVYSELEEKLKERTEMLAHLSDQNKQLEEFCYIISHNLRAPLSNLLLLGDMMEQSQTPEEKLLFAGKVKPVVDHLHETFDQLVDATQTRMDFHIARQEINLEQCLKAIIKELKEDIEDAKAEITYDFSAAPRIKYPQKYIDGILHNMLHNAIRYRSPERTAKVHVKSYISDGWLFVEVKDNGLGIDLDKHGNKLFKLHKTFHNNSDEKGFGLFISKTQVEAMGGKIHVESVPGEGTVFTLQLYKI